MLNFLTADNDVNEIFLGNFNKLSPTSSTYGDVKKIFC